jgi:hypothetical protein
VTEVIESDGKTQRMLAVLSPVLATGSEFLAGRVDADDMAHTMVHAVEAYASGEPAGRTIPELEAALAEIYGCGSGYLAHRCDSDCVARTMAQIMGEFGSLASSRVS